jgi:uncharacterized DUF497 family protein
MHTHRFLEQISCSQRFAVLRYPHTWIVKRELSMTFLFEWDDAKARDNARKHNVTFEEAIEVFSDPFLVTFADDAHSEVEARFISLGRSDRQRILLVVHTDRGDAIRLISCRKATAAERRTYE